MSLGMGVMIQMLSGNGDSVEAFTEAIGKEIASASLDDALKLTFTDGTGIVFQDDGQSCCESRYMTCDDDLSVLVGGTLVTAEVADGGTEDAEYDCHEVAFLKVQASTGGITVASHNEHNGYYGGFCIRVHRA